MDQTKVQKWHLRERPSRSAINNLLNQEGLSAYSWSNAAGERYAAHVHSYHKVIYVVEGTIIFWLPDRALEIELSPGDRLELAAGTKHGAVVGREDVTCLEAHN